MQKGLDLTFDRVGFSITMLLILIFSCLHVFCIGNESTFSTQPAEPSGTFIRLKDYPELDLLVDCLIE